MAEQMIGKYMSLSGCSWTINDGTGGFNQASRTGLTYVTTPEKIVLMGAVNAMYAMRHPGEPQLLAGFEAHVPNEVTIWEDNFSRTPKGIKGHSGKVINDIDEVWDALQETNMVQAMVTPNNHGYSIFRAATSEDPRERARAKERLDEAFEVGKSLKTKTIVLWNGGEVYSSPFEPDWDVMIGKYMETLKYAAQKAIKYDMYVAVEPKPFEPGDEMFPNNSGMLMEMVAHAAATGFFTPEEYARIGVNDEIGHVVMANCDPTQNYQILRWMGKNFHAHLNRQYNRGKHDTDNEVQMNIDTLGVIGALVTDPKFMGADYKRFGGFDYQWRHQYTGQQGLLTLYANGLRTRALERLAHELNSDPEVKQLRKDHKYAQLDSHVRARLAEVTGPVEREVEQVGREGIVVPKKLEVLVNQLAI